LVATVLGAAGWAVYGRTGAGRPGAQGGADTDPQGARGAEGKGGGGRGSGGGDRVVSVLTAPVATRDVPIFLEGIGSVVPLKTVMVKPQVDGRLDRVAFTEGQTVRKGELLAQIDPRPFTIALHQAQAALARNTAQLRLGKLNLERLATVRKENLISQQQLDDQTASVEQLEATVRSDEALIEQAKLQLDYARIKSPIDGVTGVRLVDQGNIVRANDPTGIVLLTQLDPIAVLFTLPQDDLPRVSQAMAGGKLRVEIASRDGQVPLGVGELALIDNQINQTTASIRLKALLPNPKRALWPNQFVKARLLLTTQKGALVLPAAAIQRGPQGTFVYVVGSDQKAAVRPVKVETVEGETAVLSGGLRAGDEVVTEGQGQLRPGARVAAKRADEETGPGKGKGPGQGTGKGKGEGKAKRTTAQAPP
jgi:multidrug efflux system membrane fusion protein